MKKFSCFFLLMFISTIAFSQDSDIKLFGKVVNGSLPIFNVTVVNKTLSTGTITNVYGEFEIKVQAGDLVNFSSIGYKSIAYQVPDTLSTPSFRILVSLVADTFLLKEALVVPWPQNTTMLRQAMLDQKAEKEVISPYAGFREIEGDPTPPEPKIFSNPLSFLYSKFNKKARQEKKMDKYREILQEDEMYVPEQKF